MIPSPEVPVVECEAILSLDADHPHLLVAHAASSPMLPSEHLCFARSAGKVLVMNSQSAVMEVRVPPAFQVRFLTLLDSTRSALLVRINSQGSAVDHAHITRGES